MADKQWLDSRFVKHMNVTSHHTVITNDMSEALRTIISINNDKDII